MKQLPNWGWCKLNFISCTDDVFSWDDAVAHDYALQLENTSLLVPNDANAVHKLQEMPPNWTLDHDEDLAAFLSGHVEVDNENLGSIKNYVESIDVSSFCVSLCTCDINLVFVDERSICVKEKKIGQ